MIGKDGAVRAVHFPDELAGDESALLVPAPLPVSWLKTLSFRSSKEKNAFVDGAKDFSNFSIKAFKLSSNMKLFKKTKRQNERLIIASTGSYPWPGAMDSLPDRDLSCDRALAAGAMMAMLLHMGNMGDAVMGACRLAFDVHGETAGSELDPMIKGPWEWFQDGSVPGSEKGLSSRMFWGAVDCIAGSRSVDASPGPLDAVLEFLDTAATEWMTPDQRSALEKLMGELRGLSGVSSYTITELFQRHSKPFSKAMILFFLRDRCRELLEFQHSELSESDSVGAALLFSARDGWLGLPSPLKGTMALQEAVSHRMAALAHRSRKTELNLGKPPAPPVPLRELFTPGEKGWSSKQKKAALFLARKNRWDCISTRISLGKGEYEMKIDGAGIHLILPGDVKAVVSDVDEALFLAALARTPIKESHEKEVRKSLGEKT